MSGKFHSQFMTDLCRIFGLRDVLKSPEILHDDGYTSVHLSSQLLSNLYIWAKSFLVIHRVFANMLTMDLRIINNKSIYDFTHNLSYFD